MLRTYNSQAQNIQQNKSLQNFTLYNKKILFCLLPLSLLICFLSGTIALAIEQDVFEKKIDENLANLEKFLKTYEMTDAKHTQFLKENVDYVLADTMLNFTWHAVKDYYDEIPKQHDKVTKHQEDYKKLLTEQRLWLEKGRNAVASSFSRHLTEVEAFIMAIVARTQELANIVYQTPKAGAYSYASISHLKNPKAHLIQGGHIIIDNVREDERNEKIILSGQSYSKNGHVLDIYGENFLETLPENFKNTFQGNIQGDFSAQLSLKNHPCGWLSFYAKPDTEALFFALFTEYTVYIVHSNASGLYANDTTFQGLYSFSGNKQ